MVLLSPTCFFHLQRIISINKNVKYQQNQKKMKEHNRGKRESKEKRRKKKEENNNFLVSRGFSKVNKKWMRVLYRQQQKLIHGPGQIQHLFPQVLQSTLTFFKKEYVYMCVCLTFIQCLMFTGSFPGTLYIFNSHSSVNYEWLKSLHILKISHKTSQ